MKLLLPRYEGCNVNINTNRTKNCTLVHCWSTWHAQWKLKGVYHVVSCPAQCHVSKVSHFLYATTVALIVVTVQYQIACLYCNIFQRAVSASHVHFSATYHIFWWGDILHAGSLELHPVGAVTMPARLRIEVKILRHCKESCNMHHTRTQTLAVQGELQHASHEDTNAYSAPENGLVTYAHIIA